MKPPVRPGRLSQLERAGSIGEGRAESHDGEALGQGDLFWSNSMSSVIFVIGQIVKMGEFDIV